MSEGEFRRLKLHRIVMDELGEPAPTSGTLNTEYQSFERLHKARPARRRGGFLTRISTISAAAAPSIWRVKTGSKWLDSIARELLLAVRRTRDCVTLQA